MSSNVKSFTFAAVMCLAAGFLLTFAATSLKPLQEKNAMVDRQKNVLKVLRLIDVNQKYTADQLQELYATNVKEMNVNSDGELVPTDQDGNPIYLYVFNGELKAYAVPISGYGLWSTSYGFFALEADGATVAGITFYAHGETPGLGAECEKPWFQNNFVGKRIVDSAGRFVSVTVTKGKGSTEGLPPDQLINAVDGMSGATVTSRGIDTFLRADLEKYEPFSIRLRRGEGVL